ncbi:hypothetical protein [Burkholderia gladioli]|uniref:hypothetical protein n=1 Tax=Burkholderia gladioli TaxID=28095 RepID=UPI001641E03C|nr:hypothetical protein [Burkholderia gladioli]
MNDYKLLSPAVTGGLLDKLFAASADQKFVLSVHEDKCFGEERLSLGEILLPVEDREFAATGNTDRTGSFEWRVASRAHVHAGLIDALEVPTGGNEQQHAKREKEIAKIDRVLDLLAALGTRLGLIHPTFDADSLSDFPYRRPVTIVTDTAAIAQGALDFVARFLHPAARIKIPAIAHMEIVNQGDRYFTQRRSGKQSKANTLYDHMISQGSQRVLLRLELHSDVEIERTAVMSEPLRSAFQPEREISDLNLSAPVRSFCDRLILEVARQHQAYSAPGHSVYLLTADQGLARMAMSEGISPIYYASPVAEDFLGKVLSGSTFHPLTGALHITPLTDVLWELAAAFGSARLSLPDNSAYVEVATIGKDLTWSPYHSKEDLLWVKVCGGTEKGAPHEVKAQTESALPAKPITEPVTVENATSAVETFRTKISMSRFTVERFIDLLNFFETTRIVSMKALLETFSLTESSWADYRRLFESGELIEPAKGGWSATERLNRIWSACAARDFESLREGLQRIPSCVSFFGVLKDLEKMDLDNTPFPSRVLPGYQGLAEIACVGAPIAGDGFYSTISNPAPAIFAKIAVSRFRQVAGGEKLASVGAWLEALVKHEGIHPLNARARLLEAHGAKLLSLVTEGSTTDTRHERKTFKVLGLQRGKPIIKTEYFYRGDFLIPEKSSTSFRLELVK